MPVLMASSKLFSEEAIISVTLATDIIYGMSFLHWQAAGRSGNNAGDCREIIRRIAGVW
jgi:hypothetical protein